MVTFLLEAVLISLSGVMAPGPVTAVTLGTGTRSPHAGAFVAIGHGVIEIPLMIAILYGFGTILNHSSAKVAVSLMGGLFLLFMGINMLCSFHRVEVEAQVSNRSPIVAGIALSAGNPYFIIWWATVGATLIMRSVGFGTVGFVSFAVLHWLCDFVWCYALSVLSFRGGRFLGRGFQKAVFLLCGTFLLFFSGKFIVDAMRVLFT